MEASATTLNITNGPNTSAGTSTESATGTTAHDLATPAVHNHKPNFGRYVAGCPRCIELHPDGPPAKKPKAAKSTAPILTRDDVIALLRENAPTATQSAANTDTLAQLVQLMLTKEGKQLRKEEEEAVRREAARQDMIRITREHEEMVARNQANCGHVKENGRSAINGQIHNDGLKHLFCQRCFKMFPPTRPNQEEMSNGLQMV